MKNQKRRTIKKIISPQLASEGGGLSWMSSISPSEYINYDPFISFDHFYKNESSSTGYHHTSRKFSGMINFTYLLSGQIKFRINENKIGKIKQGEMIVLNSGDGARYEQVFEPVNNHIEGFQIGINLSSSQKQAPFSLNVVDQQDTRMEFSDKGIYVRNLFKTTPDDDHTLDISDLALPPNTTYSYRVQAYNLSDVSTYSNEVTTTTIIPVELASFAANVNDREISVVWSTATELNNKGFELERKLDAQWQKVTFIEGRGTSTEKSDYYYSDKFEYDGFQGTVQYRLKQIDFDGTITYSNVISVEVDFTPKEYALYQNYPNPFNPSTTIKFALPFDSNVRIAVYNLLGEQVKVILEQVKEVGYYNVSWNASDLATGVYIYTIDAKSIDGLKNFNSVKKMMLIK